MSATSIPSFNSRRLRKALNAIPLYLIVIAFLVVVLLPIYYIFLTAFARHKVFTKP
jgi:ABC-type glycerol-3-phosphate transport system permease component